jgi:predicted esterase
VAHARDVTTPGRYRKELNLRYEKSEFSEALTRAEEAERVSPEYREESIFWQACLLCKLGRAEEGLAQLERLSSTGGWIGTEWMAWDPALEPLRTDRRFQSLMSIFDARRNEAEKQSRFQLLSAPSPERRSPGPSRGLLVLHGRGNEAQDALERWSAGSPPRYEVHALQSSQLWSPGLYQWDNETQAVRDLSAGLDAVHLIPWLAARPPVLGGFSQGALVVLRAILHGEAGDARRAILLSPSTRTDHEVGDETVELARSVDRHGISIHVLTGEKDFSLPFQRRLHDALRERGADSVLEVIPGAMHDYPPGFSGRLGDVLASVDP